MAKRKLSSEKRVALRADLKKGVASDQKTADLLRDIAKKYGIATITARWYLNGLDGKKKRKSGRGPGRPPGRRGPGRPPGSKVTDASLAKAVDAQHKSSKAAKKLVPRWQMLVDRESALRRQASKIERRLEATSEKAGKLRSRITQLVGR